MTRKQLVSLILIVVATIVLLVNLDLLTIPADYWNIIWPILIIGLGIAIYFYIKKYPNDLKISWDKFENTEIRIGNWEPQNPIVRMIIATLAIIFALTVVGLVIFGLVTPILAIVAVVVVLTLLLAIGATFIATLLPLAIVAAPFILIIWLITLLI